jgi:hypothetical protein
MMIRGQPGSLKASLPVTALALLVHLGVLGVLVVKQQA